MANKRIGILFSGGLDSTYLVWKNLTEGNDVVPIYVTIENNRSKVKLEKNRIELLYNEFKKEFPNQINYVQLVLDVNVRSGMDNIKLKQVPIWVLGLLTSDFIVDEFQIGYVANDDMISYISDFKKTYNSYNFLFERKIPIKFPLTKHHKTEMYRELPEQYKNLMVTCENPIIINETTDVVEYNACCECEACKKIIMTDYYHTGSFPMAYKENMLKRHVWVLNKNGYNVTNFDGIDFNKKYEKEVRFEPRQLRLDFNEYPELCDKEEINIELKIDDNNE